MGYQHHLIVLPMKKPRPQDYDPTFKNRIKVDDFDINTLTPISDSSSTQQLPVHSTPPQKKKATAKSTVRKKQKTYDPNVRPERTTRTGRSGSKEPPTSKPLTPDRKREIKRHSFEFFRDQLPKLKQLKAQFMIEGSDKSMSAMVREAVDQYIEEHSL